MMALPLENFEWKFENFTIHCQKHKNLSKTRKAQVFYKSTTWQFSTFTTSTIEMKSWRSKSTSFTVSFPNSSFLNNCFTSRPSRRARAAGTNPKREDCFNLGRHAIRRLRVNRTDNAEIRAVSNNHSALEVLEREQARRSPSTSRRQFIIRLHRKSQNNMETELDTFSIIIHH